MRAFEDFGFFCVDNLPPALVPMLAELCQRGQIGRIAVVTDVRGGQFFSDLTDSLEALRLNGMQFRILYLDADDDALIRRFRETRRRHPLSEEFPDLNDAIAREREALANLRARADKEINTSRVTPRELREEIRKSFLDEPDAPQMRIRVQSFGFKHGMPQDADLVFDLRFLPNPTTTARSATSTAPARQSSTMCSRTKSRTSTWSTYTTCWSSPFRSTSARGNRT
jgi:UPF0042 nucleotide-binding protein